MSKYGAKKTLVDGIVFDSRMEAARYTELRLLEQAGQIEGLTRQPEYLLLPGFTDAAGKRHRAIKHIADFSYFENGRLIVEDVKGVETAVWKLKHKMFLWRYPHIEYKVVKP